MHSWPGHPDSPRPGQIRGESLCPSHYIQNRGYSWWGGLHLNDKDLQSFKRRHTESRASSPQTLEDGLDLRFWELRSKGNTVGKKQTPP